MTDSLTWMAGFFDGEGCILVTRVWPLKSNNLKTVSHSLRVNIGNTNKAALESFHRRFGGNVFEVERDETRATSWRWETRCNDAEAALIKLLPHLQVKNQEALCALEFQELLHVTMPRPGDRLPSGVAAQRDAYYWRLRELKMEAKGR